MNIYVEKIPFERYKSWRGTRGEGMHREAGWKESRVCERKGGKEGGLDREKRGVSKD